MSSEVFGGGIGLIDSERLNHASDQHSSEHLVDVGLKLVMRNNVVIRRAKCGLGAGHVRKGRSCNNSKIVQQPALPWLTSHLVSVSGLLNSSSPSRPLSFHISDLSLSRRVRSIALGSDEAEGSDKRKVTASRRPPGLQLSGPGNISALYECKSHPRRILRLIARSTVSANNTLSICLSHHIT